MKIIRKKPNKQKINDEQLIVRGAICSKTFLDQLIVWWDPLLIQSDYYRIILEWCIKHFKNYHTAPQKVILEIFENETKNLEPEEVENIEIVLGNISEIHEEDSEFDSAYALDRAMHYLNSQLVTQLSDSIADEGPDSLQKIEDFKRIEKTKGEWCNPYTDKRVVIEAFEEKKKPLFTLPGKIGKLLNSQFNKGAFIGFLGREKIGKTWWLCYLLNKAMRNKNKVAFFEVGDMSKNQIIRRIAIQTSKLSDNYKALSQPIPVIDCYWNQIGKNDNPDDTNSTKQEYPSKKNIGCDKKYRAQHSHLPVLKITEENKQIFRSFENNLEHVPCRYCLDYTSEGRLFIDDHIESNSEYHTRCRKESRFNTDVAKKRQQEAWEINRQFKFSTWYKSPEKTDKELLDGPEAIARIIEWYEKQKHPQFRLSVHPTLSINTNDIRNILLSWRKEDGFLPNVIFIDYPDILTQNREKEIYRHAQNDTWATLRSLSLELDICIIVVTQADAKSYTQYLLDLSNFSEDKRKYSHVTAFFGLNQQGEEKSRKIMRINTLLARETDFNSKQYVTILQDLSRGQFVVDSF